MDDKAVDRMAKLDGDAIIHLLTYLTEPSDVANATAVSSSWRQMVIESRLWRTLCTRKCSEIDRFEPSIMGSLMQQVSPSPMNQTLSQGLLRDYQAYSTLHKLLRTEPWERSCVLKPISASSTDNLPDESIVETLHPSPMLFEEFPSYPSYWSSKGQESTEAPETLTYELLTPLCVVHEVQIRPFKAYFQHGNPIYSAKFVRFRMGYSSSLTSTTSSNSDSCNNYVWTYTSPEFPMEKTDTLQHFELHPPVLCVGGILQIELLGRVQTQRMDQLYYICICHVYVRGTPLEGFNLSLLKDKLFLRYDPEKPITGDGDANGDVIDGYQNESSGTVQLYGRELSIQNQFLLHDVLGNIAVQNLLAVEPNREGEAEDEDDNEASSEEEDEDENMVYQF